MRTPKFRSDDTHESMLSKGRNSVHKSATPQRTRYGRPTVSRNWRGCPGLLQHDSRDRNTPRFGRRANLSADEKLRPDTESDTDNGSLRPTCGCPMAPRD